MEAFLDAFASINQSGSGKITQTELEAYRKQHNLDPSFADKWMKMFDPDRSGEISVSEFFQGMGFNPDEVLSKLEDIQVEALKNVHVVAGDAPKELQQEIVKILSRVTKLYGSNCEALIKQLKIRLDQRFGPVWQCTMVKGAYTTCCVHVPGTNMCFRFGEHSFILFKSVSVEEELNVE